MTDCVLKEDIWPELVAAAERLGVDSSRPGLPVALDAEVGYVFRDDKGHIVHRYKLPGVNGYGAIRHFIRYASEGYSFLYVGNLKLYLVNMLEAALEKLAPVKQTITVFELGSSAGENYLYIRRILKRLGYENRVKFVGIDNVPSLVTFSRMLQHGNDDVLFLHGDGSDLSRFLDKSFDIVINHGVFNYCAEPAQAIAEVMRICRHVLCCAARMSLEANPFYATGAGNQQGYFLPTAALMTDLWQPYQPYWVYTLSHHELSDVKANAGGTGYFVGRASENRRLSLDYQLVTREPIFPELDTVCREVR